MGRVETVKYTMMSLDDVLRYVQKINEHVPTAVFAELPPGTYFVDTARIERGLHGMSKTIVQRTANELLYNSLRNIQLLSRTKACVDKNGTAQVSLSYAGITHELTYTPVQDGLRGYVNEQGQVVLPQEKFYGTLSFHGITEQVRTDVGVERFMRHLEPGYFRAPLTYTVVNAALEAQPLASTLPPVPYSPEEEFVDIEQARRSPALYRAKQLASRPSGRFARILSGVLGL